MHVPPSCQHPRSVNPDNQFPFQNPPAHDETFLFFLGTSLIWRSVAEGEPTRQPMRSSSRLLSWEPTGRQALLELLGLVRVLEDQGVEEPLAADLELDLLGVLVLLDPGGCAKTPLSEPPCTNSISPTRSVTSCGTYKRRPSAGRSR